MQKRRHSLLEAVCSTLISFGIGCIVNWIVLPLFGFDASVEQVVWITAIFTVISIIRGYYVRRLFNWLHMREIL